MIAIEPRQGGVSTAETMKIVKELTEASWQIPYSIRVDSVTNYQHTRAEEDDLIVADLVKNPGKMGPKNLKVSKTLRSRNRF